MQIHIPNSAFIGNIEGFFKKIDFNDEEKLVISSNPKWISVHPAVISLIAAIGLEFISKKKEIRLEQVTARSRNYLSAIGLFRTLNLDPGFSISEHETAGRYIPLKTIKNSEELGHFINEIVPLLHATPEQAKND